MKSEHRHELKTNELADWLTHLPEWTKENLGTIIIVVAAIIVVGGFYGWRSISNNVQSKGHEEFTAIVDSLLIKKAEILRQPQGTDMSFMLLNKAEELERYAGTIGDKNIASLALVKAGDSVRSELQYRPEVIEEKVLVEKINKAKKDYTDSIAMKPSDKTIESLAQFGLGLCAEELGDFDEARNIYNGIVENEAYAGTISVSKAELRLNIMDDYQNDIVFKAIPLEPVPDPNSMLDPVIQQIRSLRNDSNASMVIDSIDTNSTGMEIGSELPIETNVPSEIDVPSEIINLED